MIRQARVEDASRIAEILVFNKRMNYRKIFNDDHGSFCEIQVYPIAKQYVDHPEMLEKIWVLEENLRAISFYERHGFILTDEKKYEEGYEVVLVKMRRALQQDE